MWRGVVRSRRGVVTAIVATAACVPLLAACATSFGSPTRHAIANLQAASVTVSSDLQIEGLIIALPNGHAADKGDVAYLQFNVVNTATQPDELLTASATAITPASSASASPPATALSEGTLPVGSTKIPAATAHGPGTARLTVALMSLTETIAQGESVSVSLQFAKGGAVDNILVPVQGSTAVGDSFLPSAPPSIPPSDVAASSAPASDAPASGAPASTANSAPPSSPTSSS